MVTAAIARHAIPAGGLLTGIVLVAAVAGHAWRVPAAAAPAAVDVALRASAGAELAVEAAGTDVLAGDLRPGGGPSEGLLHVRNQTGQAVAARPVLRGGDEVLDRVVHVEITRRGRTLFSGPAAALRAAKAAPLTLAPAERAGARVRAWVPAGADDALLGGGTRLELGFDVEAAAR